MASKTIFSSAFLCCSVRMCCCLITACMCLAPVENGALLTIFSCFCLLGQGDRACRFAIVLPGARMQVVSVTDAGGFEREVIQVSWSSIDWDSKSWHSFCSKWSSDSRANYSSSNRNEMDLMKRNHKYSTILICTFISAEKTLVGSLWNLRWICQAFVEFRKRKRLHGSWR